MSGLGGSEAGGLGDAGYGPSGPSDTGGGGMDQAAAEAAMNAALNAPSNVLGSELAGGWLDASGRGVVSQGMNISLGLDPTHGAIGPYAGTNPNAPNQTAIDVAATLLGVTPQDLLGASAKDTGFLGEGKADLSVAGLDRGTLDAMSAAGYGGLNITDNQTVDQALAAFNVSDAMEYAVPALLGFIPNYGIVSTIGRVGAGLMSGTMTPAQALTAGIAGALGARTGVPAPVFEGILSGNFGKAAGAGVQGGLTSLANNLTGSPLGGLALNLSGIGPAVGKSVAEAVGGSRSSGLGAALGLPSAPSQGSSPTGNTYGDAGVNADIYPVLAAIEQAAQEPKQPEWSSQMTAGRYGPLMDYQFGA